MTFSILNLFVLISSASLSMADVQSELVMDSLTSAYIKARMEVQLSSSFVFKNGVIFKLWNSPQYPLIKWENKIAGDWSELYLEYRKKDFSVLFGRWHNKWGYSDRYSLILNDTLPSRNGFWVGYKIFPTLKFEYFFSSEGSYTLKKDFVARSGDTLKQGKVIQRTLIGHKLELDRGSWGAYFSEVAYCPSDGYLPNPQYLNPFFIYFLLQFNDAQLNSGIGVDANILWDFGGFFQIKHMKVYSELLIDDFQYEKVPTNEPPQIGFLLGLSCNTKTFITTFEYTRVWAWTYVHENPWERYETLGYPLGHPYGPDFDEIYFKFVRNLNDNLKFGGEFSYIRKGEVNVLTDWPIRPYGDWWDRFPPGSDFLIGTVEYLYVAKLNLKLTFKEAEFYLSSGLTKCENYGHKRGISRLWPTILVSVKYKT